ncbi:MAG: hypothetical protein LUF92_15170 [Clostridiales bacterium]|nr:hypothetical protein [Clostridiales bacterium]
MIGKKKTLLMQRQLRYQQEETNLLEITNDVEEFVQDIDDPLVRSIVEMRILDGETFVRIGHKLGYTADACRKKFDRFIEKNEII